MPCSRVIILVKAGAPVDSTIKGLSEFMEEGDMIIDGGNEWCAPPPCCLLPALACNTLLAAPGTALEQCACHPLPEQPAVILGAFQALNHTHAPA